MNTHLSANANVANTAPIQVHLWLPIVVVGLLTLSCAHTPSLTTDVDLDIGTNGLTWLEGCWTDADQTIEERWIRSREGSQLFGYSTATDSGNLVFFEQLRIDFIDGQWSLSAYPGGVGPTKFDAEVVGSQQITFFNLNNEFPQKIRYRRSGEHLVAEISLSDGTKQTAWNYRRGTL
jgi:hypothetical protein